MTKTLLLVLFSSAVAACAAPHTAMVECPPRGCAALDPHPREDALRAHAEVDLQCPAAQLAVANADADSTWVCGCGRQARYAYIYQRYAPSRWVLDSPVLRAQ